MVMSLNHAGKPTAASDPLPLWQPLLSSSLATLKRLAGATEREFLQIGREMQEIYHRSITLAGTAQNLVEVASGERLQNVIHRLRDILGTMDGSLATIQARNTHSSDSLDTVKDLLKQASEPLTGVRKMCKHLYILEVSIKIESAYLGEMGSEFINLAVDIKKLSQQIKEKVNAIQNHREHLTKVITTNSAHLHTATAAQDAMADETRTNTAESISELEAVNERFSRLGVSIAHISEENSNNISGIVQSMQFHDIFRQQVEHIVSAIEGILPLFKAKPTEQSLEDARIQLIGKTGDVCELQEAQLQFAAAELFNAVTMIVDNLGAIGGKQKDMAANISDETGSYSGGSNDDASSASFINEVHQQMTGITTLLGSYAKSNAEMAEIIRDVSGTVQQITGYVTAIEGIGHDIIQIALNARIKAASAGDRGASLGVLAEEIGALSMEAVDHTDLIAKTLAEIEQTTGTLLTEASSSDETITTTLAEMENELTTMLAELDEMGGELMSLLAQVREEADAISTDIETLTGGIEVHIRIKEMADEVKTNLQQIFRHARRLHPASDAFKEDLRLMAKRYTMESERRIHESIANRHGVETTARETRKNPSAAENSSEFGDNIDLF